MVDVAPATVERPGILLPADQRVAVVAHWSPGPAQSRSAVQLVAELQRCGYRVTVSSTSESAEPLDFSAGGSVSTDELRVLRRPNTGYDFGSWAAALHADPNIAPRDHVLLVNDSLVGPFAGLGPALADFETTSADVWGLVESDQFASHLQSFFRGFRRGVLAEPPMAAFWAGLEVVPDKDQLIAEYEFGFSEFLVDRGYSTAAFVHHTSVVAPGLNPTILGWRALLAAGVPFVKRELVRSPGLAPDGHDLPAEVTARFGVEVTEWV
ncbi:unannotated protein [freshwater metagenome]|uniref:Unannotated protein n=1 Tax=freshwater metagenome TaxID=449393 RepID=A0A6J7GMF7_9ZZZZ